MCVNFQSVQAMDGPVPALGGSHLSADAWSPRQSERSAAGPICSTTGRAVGGLPSLSTHSFYSFSPLHPFVTPSVTLCRLFFLPHCLLLLFHLCSVLLASYYIDIDIFSFDISFLKLFLNPLASVRNSDISRICYYEIHMHSVLTTFHLSVKLSKYY